MIKGGYQLIDLNEVSQAFADEVKLPELYVKVSSGKPVYGTITRNIGDPVVGKFTQTSLLYIIPQDDLSVGFVNSDVNSIAFKVAPDGTISEFTA